MNQQPLFSQKAITYAVAAVMLGCAAWWALLAPADPPVYFLSVPLDPKEGPSAADVEVRLMPTTITPATAGERYAGFDLGQYLAITGDPNLNHKRAVWSLSSGLLPAGLKLTESGLIKGTPTVHGKFKFQVIVTYRNKLAKQDYRMTVNPPIDGIKKDS